LLTWQDRSSGRKWWWGWDNFDRIHRFVSTFRTDQEIDVVDLRDAQVDDQWLSRLSRFPKLRELRLHDRQLGSGLEELRNLEQLTEITITAASNRHLIELQRFPRLELLSLQDVAQGDLGIEALSSLPKLHFLFIEDCRHTDRLLKQFPELPQLEMLYLRNCQGFTDDDLVHLQRLPYLKQLNILLSSPISDAGLIHLAQLKSLESLGLWTLSKISDNGLEALPRLENLNELRVTLGELSPEQLKTLQQLLPKTSLQEN
jgi:hypothetical protein